LQLNHIRSEIESSTGDMCAIKQYVKLMSHTCLLIEQSPVTRDVLQIEIPTLLDVRTYGDRLLIAYDKGEVRSFIVVIYNSNVYTRAQR
jgi:hypothetical protein